MINKIKNLIKPKPVTNVEILTEAIKIEELRLKLIKYWYETD